MKNIFKKILLLGIILMVSNFIYSNWFFENDLQKYSPDIKTIRKIISDKASIVYCGESSNISTYQNDEQKFYISQFIDEYLPNQTIVDFSKKASHSGIFYNLLRAIPKENHVQTLIVTMNMRSFGPDWINSNLETPLQKDLVLLKPYPPLVNRFLLGFKNYNTTPSKINEKNYKWELDHNPLNRLNNFPYKTATEWEAYVIKNGSEMNTELHSMKNRELASQYIKSYAFNISSDNPRVKDFDEIIQLAKDRHWKLIFHILPENVDRAQELVGQDLIQMINRNKEFLLKRYQGNQVKVVDNLSILPNDQFIDQDWTSEHYKESGRKIIAKKISKVIEP